MIIIFDQSHLKTEALHFISGEEILKFLAVDPNKQVGLTAEHGSLVTPPATVASQLVCVLSL